MLIFHYQNILAMRVATADSSQALEDIKVLSNALQISTVRDMLIYVARYILKSLITPKMRLAMKEALRYQKRRVKVKKSE